MAFDLMDFIGKDFWIVTNSNANMFPIARAYSPECLWPSSKQHPYFIPIIFLSISAPLFNPLSYPYYITHPSILYNPAISSIIIKIAANKWVLTACSTCSSQRLKNSTSAPSRVLASLSMLRCGSTRAATATHTN